MAHPLSTNDSARGHSRPTGKRRVLNARLFVGTFAVLAVLAVAAYFWRGFQVRRTASALTARAETLAAEGKFVDAEGYYSRYLELRPDDAAARLRRAELFEKSERGSLQRAAELYQEALRPAGQVLPAEKQLLARRRLTELLLQGREFAAAESETEKLRELEEKELAKKPEEWRAPGLRALALAGKFQANNAAVPRETVEEKFREVLEPKSDERSVYRDAEVYLARYQYRRQQKLPQANEDLAAALKVAPTNLKVLLTAAGAAQGDAAAAAQAGNREKTKESYLNAIDFYKRAVTAVPANPFAYQGLGRLYASLNDLDRAIQTWRDGLAAVRTEGQGIDLNLDLADVLIQQGRLPEAENVLKTLDGVLAKLNPGWRLSYQRRADLRRAKLLLQKAQYDEAVRLADDVAVSREAVAVQGREVPPEPQLIYKAYMVSGAAHAALKHWDPALAAYGQAAMLEPGDPTPRLAAAAACKAAERRDAAITCYQQALAIINAMKPLPEGQRQVIYDELIALLDTPPQRAAEAARYRTLRDEQMTESARLTSLGVAQAIRDGKLTEAVAVAQRGVESRPQDPAAYLLLGQTQRANKDDAKAADAMRKAVEVSKDKPQVQMAVAESLLSSPDRDDRVLAEKVLRDLATQHADACLRLTGLLAGREKPQEALAVAQQGVVSQPKDALAHIALGLAWWASKDNAKAEAAFKDAARLAPDDLRPLSSLFDFYVGTGQTDHAREALETVTRNKAFKEVERAVLLAEGYARLGDRPRAKDAYEKAVKTANGDPNVDMRLAEFLLQSHDQNDAAEGEKMLRVLMQQQFDPARRRLAELLLTRGGEAEWEEAQRLLEPTATGPASSNDRLLQAVTLRRRGGAENLAKAEQICQAWLADAKQPPPAVRLLLADIQDRQGKPEEARQQFQTLVADPHVAPLVRQRYADFLLHRGPAAAADTVLKQLEQLAPADLGTLELRARWLRDQKRTAEIEPLVEAAAETLEKRIGADDPRQTAKLCQAVGALYERIGQHAAAERWYRRLLKLAPEAYELLAVSLAKQGRTQEALALCDEAGKADKSARPARRLAGILLSGRATADDLKQAEPALQQALENHKDDLTLLANVANVRILQGRLDDAIALYRQVLQQQPRNPEVLNNLATLLAERPTPAERQEALQHIDEAIKLSGPQPGLLDTKGMALFFAGQAEQAVEALKEAAQAPNPDPRYCFHLAVAYARLEQLDKARVAFQQARAGDLDHQLLTNMDRQLLTDLEKKLGL